MQENLQDLRIGIPLEDEAMSIAAFFSRMGMKSKFFIITTCAIIAAMSIAGYLVVQRERDILYAEAEKQGRLLGETLAIPIVNDLIYERLGLVEEGGLLDDYIHEMFKRKDLSLLYIAVLDGKGKVIADNDIRQYGKVYNDPLTWKELFADRTTVQHFSAGGHDALDIGVPLSIGTKRWGTLKLGMSLKKAELEILSTVRKIVLMTVVFLLAGFAIIMLLSRRFISPIIHLSNTMEKARGDYLDLQVDVRGHDELAVLGERFNSMIARIRQANEELRKTHEKMIQSEKLASVGILAAGVAHEINNPLGGIFNFVQMLKENGGDPQLREKYLDLINEGMGRIENTVSKLLWMSQKEEHKPVDVNIRGAVDSVYAFLEYKMKRGGIAFINGVPAGLRFTFDVHDFQQILFNLFINSIQAMDGGGTLEITGGWEHSGISIEVADNGCGIEAENIGRLFDPFFTTKPAGEGTGLGLWLTYEIIRNYNGDIGVESEPGKGSRFILRFPVEDAA